MNEAQSVRGSIGEGLVIGVGLCVSHALLTRSIIERSGDGLVALFWGAALFGLIQLVYMIPGYLFLRKYRPQSATGLAIFASVVGLINATCAVVMF